jgi:hypothetical protein
MSYYLGYNRLASDLGMVQIDGCEVSCILRHGLAPTGGTP